MPSSRWPVHVDATHLYFVTMGTVKRTHVFGRAVVRRILVDCLNTGRILGQYNLYAFVIMPNHVHLILRCLNEYTPSDIVREYKKATSNLIVRQYDAEGNQRVLEYLASCVGRQQKQVYAVWREEYQAKNVFSPDFLRQKLEYVHNNPVQPHWALADRPQDYVWSSAAHYLADRRSLIPLSDVGEFLR